MTTPSLEGALLLVGGKLGELSLSPAEVTLQGVEGGYDVGARLGFRRPGGPPVEREPRGIVVEGFVPFAPTLEGDLAKELAREGLDLRVTADEVPLTAIAAAWPKLEATAGTLSMDGTITGSVDDPVPDLTFGLKGGDFYLVPTGVRYAEAGFTGHLGKDELRVQDLSARTLRVGQLLADDGTIEGQAVARRVGDRPVFDGAFTFTRAWIIDVPERLLRVAGTLKLGERAEKVRLTGRLAVVDGNLVVPERFFTGASDLSLAPDIHVLRRGEAPREAAAAAAEGFTFPTWLDADVNINLDRSAFLVAAMPMEQVLGDAFRSFSSIELSTQLDGEVVAGVHDGALSLVGKVQPLRGLARVFGRPFDVRGNTISFTGLDYTDPVLDLVAVNDNPDYGEITTTITGTPSALQLGFSSETLGQEDILSVLVLGKTTNDLAAGEGASLKGLLSSVATGLVNQTGSSSGLFDVFEVGGESVRIGTRIRGSGFFKTDLFVVGEYDWSADPTKENVGEVTLEWRVGRRWQFDLMTGTEGFSAVSLNRRWRF